MIPIGEDLALAAELLVQRFGDAALQALHRARERLLIFSLNDQMKVIRQYRKVHDAHAEKLFPRTQLALHDRKALAVAQIADITGPQRDQDGSALYLLRTRIMRSVSAAFSARTLASTASRRECESLLNHENIIHD